MTRIIFSLFSCTVFLCSQLLIAGAKPGSITENVGSYVLESPRDIPVAFEADVVVVGGSTGAVAAAVEAARDGAMVFLAAPNPYLGEDMTATLMLWLEKGEKPGSPLLKEIFSEKQKHVPFPGQSRMLRFSYKASVPSAGVHKDTVPPSLLSDLKWNAATNQSVQYDGDVDILLDLGKEKDLERVYVMAYQKSDFKVSQVIIYAGGDGLTWEKKGVIKNGEPEQATTSEPALPLSAKISCSARYLKLSIKKAPSAKRILLGEIAVVKTAGKVGGKTNQKVGGKANQKAGGKPAEEESMRPVPPARPFHVKKVLDKALLSAGVKFLYSSFVTDILRDKNGEPAGIVIANRSGRQAITAKVIIDATGKATAACLAGAGLTPFPAGKQKLKRVVIGGAPRMADGMTFRKIFPPFWKGGKEYDIIEYTLELPMESGDFASYAKAEQLARDMTYDPGQQFTSDNFFQVPPVHIHGKTSDRSEWKDSAALDLRAFSPANLPRVFVLSGCADISRSSAERLLRPPELVRMGIRIGKKAAELAEKTPVVQGARLPAESGGCVATGEVREFLSGISVVENNKSIREELRPIPVIGKYDVVVIGGGTSGAPAGISAARHGAKTLVVELLHGLGGVGTQGAISKYYWGNRIGFSAEVAHGPAWKIEQKSEWWRTTLEKSGADIWFGSIGCGVLMDGNRVTGAVVATPRGRGVVLAKVVVDATGNADAAAAAGAKCYYTGANDIAMQGTGLPPRRLGATYTNTDFTIVDETSMLDVWQVFVYVKYKIKDAFDLGKLIDTRERRRIVGDFTVSIIDEVNHRTFPDTIVETYSDFDTHGYTVDPYFVLQHPPHQQGYITRIPYRALLPRGIDGVIVTGLGLSAKRDALPLIRMQADIQNQGYAAGLAAAMVAEKGCSTRDLDVKELQKHLIKIGNLPEEVLTAKDSYPFSDEKIREAVENVRDNCRDIAVIFTDIKRALPLLRNAYKVAETGKDKLTYAKILAVLGDDIGLDTLIKAVDEASGLGEGWRYKGMGQYGPNMGPVDSLIYALGCTRNKRALPAILKKLKLLKPGDAFSHFRAMVLALEKIGDPSAAGPLYDVLQLPGIQGHASTTIKSAIERAKKWPSMESTEPRSMAIRELILGRALFRCGDKKGLGRKILTHYVHDLRGHLARHAKAVLDEEKNVP